MDAVHILEGHGLRNTPVRRALLQILSDRSHAISHAELEQHMDGSVDRVTLYRTLNTFEEKGILHKVLDREGTARFALCHDTCSSHHHVDEHLHFHCLQCARVFCLHVAQFPDVSLPPQFQVRQIQLSAEGICPECAAKA